MSEKHTKSRQENTPRSKFARKKLSSRRKTLRAHRFGRRYSVCGTFVAHTPLFFFFCQLGLLMLSNTPSAVVDHAWRPQSLRRYQTKNWIWLRSEGRMEKARRRSMLVMHITLVGKNICEPWMPEAPSFPCARNRRDREQHDNVSHPP